MLIKPILHIALGLFLWRLAPKWIKYGNRKDRSRIQLICCILGIIIFISGILQVLKILDII